jgi:DNA-binding transcriptional ArsR family regulator
LSRPLAQSDVFQAIADPTRRAILDRLQAGPAPVNSLAEGFPQSRPAISKHLRILKDAGIVSEQRQGRERVYRLHPDRLSEIADWLLTYRDFWQTSLNRLKQRLEEER